ncbi:5-oxoprolinase/urea amidolyase family protein [Enterobacteriaceae bacterium H20N1]|uniref:5-oxoprolinase/urea amidolyase family protein n=1 Tax=Dryocola boscaweniae TaxID=2925397 RepID=A0A9X2W5W1_9ENTR|nr:urea amidolyase family protein [Dryocola boscaweniae]MCT4701380.1 5-oxoprolinase/urea amidolyase family protein [Dryocola boscaweniae]MCT4718709.1 5-oxoprolinase/urea amidolyase family protein [Dryocola boscaweniae]
MRFLAVNLSSFLVELGSLDDTLALFDSLSRSPAQGIEEIIPAARTLLIRFQPTQTSVAKLAEQIARRPLTQRGQRSGQQVTIPVHYNGEDLSAVAELMGIGVQEVIRRHQESTWNVAFTGFAPGFAYMVSDNGGWRIPRRSTPRTRIPAGSVALAGEFSGIYPQASPGGWQLIGQTELQMWDMAREQPALLLPGAQVRFVDGAAGAKTISLPSRPCPQAQSATEGATLSVLATGLQTLWQDDGRVGKAAMGLSESGAMDKIALHAANRIVGNPVNSPCLETLGGFRARANGDVVISVTGAPCPVALRTSEGECYAVESYRPLNLAAGDEIHLGTPTRGLRSYLAVRSGFVVQQSLGSAARDSLAQVGPEPLCAGDILLTGAHQRCNAVLLDELPVVGLPAAGETVTLDIILGPRTDWFSAKAVEQLTTQAWQVTPQSNRIGLRLCAEQPLARCQHQELPSEGTCSGSIQVPASGQPVLFLHDHPLTGGYPVIAAVAEYHLALAGQIPPGASIRFNVIQSFVELTGSTASDHRAA